MDNLLTAEQFYSLTDSDDLWELIKGKLFMSPAPLTRHQIIVGEMHLEIGNKFRRDSRYHVRLAPYDVNLSEDTIVQPDVCVIDDLSKENRRGYKGSPVLVVEVISPSSGLRDSRDKLKLYEEFGVEEFWLVNPVDNTVKIFVLESGKYVNLHTYSVNDTLKSVVFSDLEINLQDVFN